MIYQRKQYEKGGPGRWYWDFRDKIAFSFIQPDDRYIVDIGCGEGIGLEKLKNRFPEKLIFGIDLEKENVEICRRFGLDVMLSDVYNLPLVDNSIDLCISIDMLEHLKRPSDAIGEINRVLKKGGRLIMTIPNDRNFFLARIAMLMFKEAFYDAGHEKRWIPKLLENLLKNCGFIIKDKKNLPFFFWQTSLHHLIIAVKK